MIINKGFLGDAGDVYATPDMTIVSAWATTLFTMAEDNILMVPDLVWHASQVANAINIQLGPAQKFWAHEILQAAKLISNKYAAYIGGYNLWSISLMNNMGWRVVAYTACPPDKTLDSVTRTCITKPIIPPYVPPDNGTDDTTRPPDNLDILPNNNLYYLLGAGAILALFILQKK